MRKQTQLILTAVGLLTSSIVVSIIGQVNFLITVFYVLPVNYMMAYGLLTGGMGLGFILSIIGSEAYGIRKLMLISYAIIVIIFFVICFIQAPMLVMFALAPLGLFCGVGLCSAWLLLITVWQDTIRSALLVVEGVTIILIPTLIFVILSAFPDNASFTQAATLITGGAAAMIWGLIALNRGAFDELQSALPARTLKSEWNIGIVSSGISLGLHIMVLFVILLLFLLRDSVSSSSWDIGNAFRTWEPRIMLGSALIAALLLLYIRVHYFLLAMMIALLLMVSYLLSSQRTELVAYLFFAAPAFANVLVRGFFAYGIACVARPTIRHVAYLFFCAGIGVWLGLASMMIIVFLLSQQAMLLMILIIYLIVFSLLMMSLCRGKGEGSQST